MVYSDYDIDSFDSDGMFFSQDIKGYKCTVCKRVFKINKSSNTYSCPFCKK